MNRMEFGDLYQRVIKTYYNAIRPGLPLGSVYGGVVGLHALGADAVR
jgi:hypothetical protein